MKLREIVYDDELQRIDVLKDKAKQAHQELLDARASLKSAKAKQAMLRARFFSVPVPSDRRDPHEAV